MIYAAVILGAVILFYAWLVLAARFQEDRDFRVGDWVKVTSDGLGGFLTGKVAKVVFTSDEVVKIEIRGEAGVAYVCRKDKAKKHLTLLEAV